MEKLKVGDCLLGKGPDEWDEDCIGLYRVLDIDDDICEAYCYEITDRGYYKEMTEIELPISPDFKIIPVEIHDKITNLINDAISSSLSIIADAKTRPVSSIKTGDCFLIPSLEYESKRICKIIDIDIEGDNEDNDTRYSTLDYIVDKNELVFSCEYH